MNDYIIWYPLWYPNRTDPYSGDFIQRHARAASAFRNIEVVVAIRDISLPPGVTEEVRSENGGLCETIIYYNTSNIRFRPLNRLMSFFKYRKIIDAMSKRIFQIRGIPSALHTHIYGKNCYIPWRLSYSSKVPLFYSEQQTGLVKEGAKTTLRWGILSKFLLKKFLSRTKKSSFVSDYLGASVRRFYPKLSYAVIPNVVDDNFFMPSSSVNNATTFQFIHISTLTYQKNFDDIITAIKYLTENFINFELHVFGPFNNEWQNKIKNAGLEKYIFFEGEQPHEIILPFLQSSDALILYSRFETFGCVVIEAMSCGVPVIVSDISPMRELIREGKDGIIVAKENPEKLAETLYQFTQYPLRPDKTALHREIAQRYGMKKIGELFERFYRI
jgi:glycosyltransferase involved in cell wall biosynthesis